MKKSMLFLSISMFCVSCGLSKKIPKYADRLISDSVFQNAHTGITFYDPAKNKFLYSYQGDKYFVPASNTKLASCYLAMKYLGDSIAAIKFAMVNDTTVLIKGMGDPTFLHPDFVRQPAYNFLKQFKIVAVASPGFSDYLGNGWSWGDYEEDYMAPRSAFPLYGDVVRFESRNSTVDMIPRFFRDSTIVMNNVAEGFTVNRPWSFNQFTVSSGRSRRRDVPFIPYDSTVIGLLADTLHAQVRSSGRDVPGNNYVYTQPLDSLLSIMMHRSDNFFAEQSLLMVSNKLLEKMDDRSIIRKALSDDFSELPQMPAWVDGSGLSRYNLFSPKDFAFILNKMKNEFGLQRMKTILPTGGTGTLSSLYKEEAGYIFAKTGTLNGVVALSGYLITSKNRLLIFSILVNNHRGAASDIRKGIERFLKEVRKNG